MKVVFQIGRMILGAIFLVFGLNKLIPLFTTPPPVGLAGDFMAGLAASGYFFVLLAIVEITSGFLLLVGRFVPLALVMLAPIVLNIFAYHLFLAPGGLPLALLLVLLGVGLAWGYRDSYRTVLASEATPRLGRRKHQVRGPDRRRHAPHKPAEV